MTEIDPTLCTILCNAGGVDPAIVREIWVHDGIVTFTTYMQVEQDGERKNLTDAEGTALLVERNIPLKAPPAPVAEEPENRAARRRTTRTAKKAAPPARKSVKKAVARKR